jgi:RNA polymerase sigma-70 factor (ECF subfamily)
MQDEESSVLKAFQQGSIDAFETLFRLHQPIVYHWALRIVRSPSAAEDVTVETFWRIHRAHARYQPSRSFEAWARTIATHAALDWLRAQTPWQESQPAPLENLPALPSTDPAVTAEIREKTALAFRRLPPKLRIAAILAVVEELPHKQIAESIGISTAAVKVRVFRALRLLRKDLKQQGITP